jgi:rubrerythrin
MGTKMNKVMNDTNTYTATQYETSLVVCDLCGHSWVAVRPQGLEKLECPNCDNMVYFENID